MLATLFAGSVAPAAAADAPGTVLRRYLDARWRGDLAAAEALWDPGDVRRSQALGTRYAGLEARYDDNLLWSPAARAAATAQRPAVRDSALAADSGTFTVVHPRRAGADTLRYGVRTVDGEWRVVSAFEVVTRPWTVRDGRFVRVRAARLRDFNADALNVLDSGLERMLQQLGAPEQTRLRLERLKIDYALCATAAEVRAILGSRPAGSLPAGERVVSRSNSDLEALARIAVHLVAKDAPLYASPWIEDGLAVALGGSSDRAPATVLQHGAARVATGGPEVEAVLEPARYASMPVATRVPVAAAWTAALLQALGSERFIALYRDLSVGGEDAAPALDAATVRQRLETATGKRGTALGGWLREQTQALVPPLAPGYGARMPVETRTEKPILRWRDQAERWTLEAFEVGDDYVFVVRPFTGAMPEWTQRLTDSLLIARGEKPPPRKAYARPPGDPPQLALTIKRRMQNDPEAYESALFLEHFRQRRYAGELFGVFIGIDAVRVWDYRRDTLIAALTPETTPAASKQLYDEPAGRVAFRLRRDTLPGPLTDYVATNGVYTGE